MNYPHNAHCMWHVNHCHEAMPAASAAATAGLKCQLPAPSPQHKHPPGATR
jgi:hypothetical protein